jgi:MerR family transcriptional regulator, heat shock protein HspR
MSTARRAADGVLIGIAAELAGMHPQTLRVYERRGLITPRRSAGNTRLYSADDVALLRRIQELSEEGLNLAGIERVLKLEARLGRAERRIRGLQEELKEMTERHREELAAAKRAAGALVPAGGIRGALVPRYLPVIMGSRTRLRTRGRGA